LVCFSASVYGKCAKRYDVFVRFSLSFAFELPGEYAMNMYLGPIRLVGVVAVLALFACAAPAWAVDPDPAVQKTFDKMLAALKDNNREVFVAEGTEDVKKGMTKEIMEDLQKLLGARLKKGYTPTYLCQLNQAGHQIHLWKLAFKDKGDDVVVRLAQKDGKVAGFFLQ
jgi:hypothetical protein